MHAAGGVIFCQLWHMGRTAGRCFHGLQPVAASAIAAEGRVTDYDGNKHAYEVPRALLLDEISAAVNEYRIAARNAKEAGFDGVEIHGANGKGTAYWATIVTAYSPEICLGYFIDTFLQSSTNHRTDAYGGSVENRFRILAEVIEACKEAYPSTRIGVRLSPNGVFGSMGSGDNYDSYLEILSKLDKLNLAYVHVMDGLGFGFHDKCKALTLSDARSVYKGFIIGNVGYTKETAEEVIQSGDADMIAFGRPYISNPDLPGRFENGYPIAEASHQDYWTNPDSRGGDPRVGYTDFPVYSPNS